MNPTQRLHDLGQSIWLDNITRDMLNNGTLKRYIDELAVTGLTSNPTIFDHAIKNSATYDDPIRQKVKAGEAGEDLFFGLAVEDLSRAADLFHPIHERTNGVEAGSPSRSPRSWPTTPRARWRPPRACISRPARRTSSSRSPAPLRACRPSRRRSSPGSRST